MQRHKLTSPPLPHLIDFMQFKAIMKPFLSRSLIRSYKIVVYDERKDFRTLF